jgi:hypothetical protein
MSTESLAVDQFTERMLPDTDLTCLSWLHALDDYLSRDTAVTDAVLNSTGEFLQKNEVPECWHMVSDGSTPEKIPHFGYLAHVRNQGIKQVFQFPNTASLILNYSQSINSGPFEEGNIRVMVKLPETNTPELAREFAYTILASYQKQIGLAYPSPEFVIRYDESGAQFEEI